MLIQHRLIPIFLVLLLFMHAFFLKLWFFVDIVLVIKPLIFSLFFH